MSKKKEGVYLAELDVYGYSLTAVGKTKTEAIKAVRDAYYEGGELSPGGCPRDETGEERSFKDYAEYASFYVHYLPFGKCDWL